jgi:hypothetical protein
VIRQNDPLTCAHDDNGPIGNAQIVVAPWTCPHHGQLEAAPVPLQWAFDEHIAAQGPALEHPQREEAHPGEDGARPDVVGRPVGRANDPLLAEQAALG